MKMVRRNDSKRMKNLGCCSRALTTIECGVSIAMITNESGHDGWRLCPYSEQCEESEEGLSLCTGMKEETVHMWMVQEQEQELVQAVAAAVYCMRVASEEDRKMASCPQNPALSSDFGQLTTIITIDNKMDYKKHFGGSLSTRGPSPGLHAVVKR